MARQHHRVTFRLVCPGAQSWVLSCSASTLVHSPISLISMAWKFTYMQMTPSYTYFFNLKQGMSESLLRIEACIVDIRAWMRTNKLKLNDEKTEYMVISSDHVKANIIIPKLTGAMTLKPSPTIRNLGAMFDDALKMTSHISAITQNAHFHLRNIRAMPNQNRH